MSLIVSITSRRVSSVDIRNNSFIIIAIVRLLKDKLEVLEVAVSHELWGQTELGSKKMDGCTFGYSITVMASATGASL